MANLNRDYLVTLDVKTSNVTLSSPMTFYVTDRRTMNIFVKLVMNMSDNPIIKDYVALENAVGYRTELVLVAPNKQPFYLEGELLNGDEALFCFNLDSEQISKIGDWVCELRVYSIVDADEEIVTSRSFLYSVNESITTSLDDVVLDNTTYGIIDELIGRIEDLESGSAGGENDLRLNILGATKYDDVQVLKTDGKITLTFFANKTKMKTVEIPASEGLEQRVADCEESIAWLLENGGGGSGIVSAYLSTTDSENFVIPNGVDLELHLDFYSPNIGKGTLKVSVDDVDIMSTTLSQGETTVIVTGDMLHKGLNTVKVYAVDRAGVMTNVLQFNVRYGSTELTTTFDQYQIYDVGAVVRYYFTAIALNTADKLTFHMLIDNQAQTPVECTSDVRAYFTFPILSIGTHYCEAWVEDSYGKSNILAFNFVVLDETSLVINSTTRSASVEEGAQLTLDYRVYRKNTNKFITETYIDNELVNTGECNADTNFYTTSSLAEGRHIIKIIAYDLDRTVSDFVAWSVNITPSTYQMKTPIKTGSIALFTAKDRTNSDQDRDKWTGVDQDNNTIVADLNGFSYDSDNGWNNNELIISGKSNIEIPIAPLANNARYGFTLDIEFTSKQIGVEDAEVLTLWNETDNCGIKITTERLILRSKDGNECNLYFSDNENVSAMFIIDRDEKTAKIYLNGVMCEAFSLSDYVAGGQTYLEDFTVPGNIILGGGADKNGYCKIKNLRIYEVALATNEILNNWLSNITDKTAQREMEKFQDGADLPTLTLYCDFAGLGKDDKKPCDIIYYSPDVTKYGESFTLSGKTSQLQYQGTSSMQYPIKNYRLNLRDAKGDKWYYNPYGEQGGQGECRFTLKADFMSSGHWQNTGLAKFVSDKLYGYKTNDLSTMNPAKRYDIQNGGTLKDTRDSINGFPCRLILVNDGSTPLNEGQQEPTPGNTKDMGIFNFNNDKDNVSSLGLDTEIFPNALSYEVTANSDTSAGAFVPFGEGSEAEELEYLQQSFELRYPDSDDVGSDYGYLSINGDTSMGLKRVIDWVGNCTDEEFKADYEKYFNKHYLLRYYLLVITLGMVDNLGKNMMLDTWDGQIWYPRFYDMDTICSYDNSGAIKFDVDIEMEQGYWNTSASRLWTKVRDLLHDELVVAYKDMRASGLSYDGLMNYFYGEQISKIPQKYYNQDADVKYLPYADEYLGKAHGDGYEHLKRWLKNRLIFVDTLFDYAPSYESDMLTIRANTLDPITFEIETYTPVYQHVSYYNGQMSKLKIDGKTATTFTGKAQTATDQEILIYGGSNIKRIRGISSANPDSMLIGNATKLAELDISNCPILVDVNSNKANFAPHQYLNKLNIENCPQLGGTLELTYSPLIQEIKAKGTAISGLRLPTSVKNLETLELPNTISSLVLYDASSLETLKFDEGVAMQSIELSNCAGITNTENFDLTKTPTVILDNSYNTDELYMSETTNLTLRNMSNLERVIYTPNSEYSEFDINNVINGRNYKITTSSCPKLSIFMTTAPFRLSYPPIEVVEKQKNVLGDVAGSFTNSSYINSDTGGFGTPSDTACACESYIPITPGKEYIFTTNSTHNVVQIVFYKADKSYQKVTNVSYLADVSLPLTFTAGNDYHYFRFHVSTGSGKGLTLNDYLLMTTVMETEEPITPNTSFTANTLDLSSTQFTDIKLLCTTDVYNLKVPTTMKNFYCDSAMDIDTDVIEEASYEVIHEELIEPYTTNYEGEVVRCESVVSDLRTYPSLIVGSQLNSDWNINSHSSWSRTDYIQTNKEVKIISSVAKDSSNLRVQFYDKDKVKVTGQISNYGTICTFTPPNNTVYVIVSFRHDVNNAEPLEIVITENRVPNIIPSSANGSLIFNMYSNNTTQPTSTSPYMWDLTGLKLNDFYTYGMNNWVKGGKTKEYIVDKVNINDETYVTCRLNVSSFNGSVINTGSNDMQVEFYSPSYISSHVLAKNEEMTIPSNATQLIFIFSSSEGSVSANGYTITLGTLTTNNTTTYNLETFKQEISKPITMPQRMPGYSVRLVNADITPNEYPTMLYPKLIDTTLPITGKLDYTAYNGTSLAWAYAYTTSDVTISRLADESNITCDYNKEATLTDGQEAILLSIFDEEVNG